MQARRQGSALGPLKAWSTPRSLKALNAFQVLATPNSHLWSGPLPLTPSNSCIHVIAPTCLYLYICHTAQTVPPPTSSSYSLPHLSYLSNCLGQKLLHFILTHDSPAKLASATFKIYTNPTTPHQCLPLPRWSKHYPVFPHYYNRLLAFLLPPLFLYGLDTI